MEHKLREDRIPGVLQSWPEDKCGRRAEAGEQGSCVTARRERNCYTSELPCVLRKRRVTLPAPSLIAAGSFALQRLSRLYMFIYVILTYPQSNTPKQVL